MQGNTCVFSSEFRSRGISPQHDYSGFLLYIVLIEVFSMNLQQRSSIHYRLIGKTANGLGGSRTHTVLLPNGPKPPAAAITPLDLYLTLTASKYSGKPFVFLM